MRTQCLGQTGQAVLHTQFRQRGHGVHHLIQIGQPIQVTQNQLDHHLLAQNAYGSRQVGFIVQSKSGLLQQSLHFRAVAGRIIALVQPIQQGRVCLQGAFGITTALQGFFQQGVEGCRRRVCDIHGSLS